MARTTKGLPPDTSEAVRKALLQRESEGRGGYQAVNRQGFVGGYQFGLRALEDIGWVKKGTNDPKLSIEQNNARLNDPSVWNVSGGKDYFLNSPGSQDVAYAQYSNVLMDQMTRLKVIDQTTSESDKAGYLSAAWLGGAGGARDLKNNIIRQDANKTPTSEYFNLGKDAATEAQAARDRTEASLLPGEEIVQTDQLGEPPSQVSPELLGQWRQEELARINQDFARMRPESSNNTVIGDGGGGAAEQANVGQGAATQAQPIPNPLTSFVSFSYIFTLGVVPEQMLENPDGYGTVILQSANGLEGQRLASGRWDFYIDEVEMDTIVGYIRPTQGTNLTTIEFTVIEPYSIGLFLESLQVASGVIVSTATSTSSSASDVKYINYANAPFMLTIEFVGWDDDGNSVKLPDAIRRIALRLVNIEMDISTKGTRYKVQAIPWAEYALTDEFNRFKTDFNYSFNNNGPYTVEDILKTAEKSLEAGYNLASKTLAEKSNPKLDQYDTINIKFDEQATDIKTSMIKFDMQSGGASSPLKETDVMTDGQVNRSKMKYDDKNTAFTYNQGSTVVKAITEIILRSEYCKKSLQSKQANPTGMIDWFRIETEIRSKDTEQGRGRPAYDVTFKIVKYKIHSSRLVHPSAKPNYDILKSNVVKVYDYIYTGKNTEVLNFDINLKYGFFTTAYADKNQNNSDIVYGAQLNAGGKTTKAAPLTFTDPIKLDGSNTDPGNPSSVTGSSITARDATVGGPPHDALSLLSRTFHEALLNSYVEMVTAELEIMGDPYYIISSGTANASFSNTGSYNITGNGEMNYQNGEVDIELNFRTPVDIDPDTGLADFGNTEIMKGFSGLYQVIQASNKFRQGKFIQVLTILRRPRQYGESSTEKAVVKEVNLDIYRDTA